MKLTFLGTGTSSGIPVIGCHCKVCLSKNKKDKRLRCTALLKINNSNILIDAGPDIREQLITHHVQSIAGILITHSHYDHIIGLDELRPFSWSKPINLYTDEYSLNEIKRTFNYIFDSSNIQIGGGLTQFNTYTLTSYQDFCIHDIVIKPLTVMHGRLSILGYKIHNLAYLTDVKTLPRETILSVKGINTLILSCLRLKEHSTHLNLDEALKIIDEIRPNKTYLIHMNHELSHMEWSNILPENVFVAYDGLELTIE